MSNDTCVCGHADRDHWQFPPKCRVDNCPCPSYRPRSEPEQTGEGESLVFGDRCLIEQQRHGAPNEKYEHKVIGAFKSNRWVEVPVQAPAREVVHSHSEQVVSCVTCGVDETKVLTYRLADCQPTQALTAQVAAYRVALEHYADEANWVD